MHVRVHADVPTFGHLGEGVSVSHPVRAFVIKAVYTHMCTIQYTATHTVVSNEPTPAVWVRLYSAETADTRTQLHRTTYIIASVTLLSLL